MSTIKKDLSSSSNDPVLKSKVINNTHKGWDLDDKENIQTNISSKNKESALSFSKDDKIIESKKENSNNNSENVDKTIKSLRSAYNNMRKDRINTEKETEYLEHKLKLLQSEEQRAYKRYLNEKKFKEDWDSARLKTEQFRKNLNEVKQKKQEELKDMTKRIKDMRNFIQKTSNVKKMMKFQENRLSNLQMKQKKYEYEELRKYFSEENNHKKKRHAESVKMREKNYIEKKKNLTDQKKKMMKDDLQKLLSNEMEKKKAFEEKLNHLETIETEILKRLKNSKESKNNNHGSKIRSTSTSHREPDKSKSVKK